jgi:hypothetical protein
MTKRILKREMLEPKMREIVPADQMIALVIWAIKMDIGPTEHKYIRQ